MVCVLGATPALFAEHSFQRPNYPTECAPQDATRIALLTETLRKGGKLLDGEADELRKLIRKVPTACLSGDLVSDAESAMKNFALLPCIIPEERQREMTVTLSGEVHTWRPEKMVKKLREDAANGKLIAVFETNCHFVTSDLPSCPPILTPNVVVNADGLLPRAFMHLFETTSVPEGFDFVSGGLKHEYKALISLLARSEKEDRYRELYEKLSKAIEFYEAAEVLSVKIDGSSGERTEARKADEARYYSLLTKGDGELEQFRKLLKREPPVTTAMLFARTKETAIRMLSEPEFIFRHVPPLVSQSTERGNKYRQEVEYHQEVVTAWRDREMAWTLARQLCRASDKKISRVHLHAGRAHIPGVYAELKRLLKNSGVNIPVGVDISSMTKNPVENRKGLLEWLKQLPEAERK